MLNAPVSTHESATSSPPISQGITDQNLNAIIAFCDSAPVALCLSDAEGKIIRINQLGADLLGYSQLELKNRKFADFIIDADKGRYREHSRRVLQSRICESVITSLMSSDGDIIRYHFVSDSIGSDGGAWLLRHWITPDSEANELIRRRQAERALQEAEARYRDLRENVPVGLFRSIPAGYFIFLNNTALEILGFTRLEDALRTPLIEMYADPDSRLDILRILETQGEVKYFETQFIRQDGAPIRISISARAVQDFAGKTLYYDGSIQDVTARHNAQNALKESEGQLRTIFESAHDAIFIKDQHQRYVRANPRMAYFTGIPIEEIIGKTNEDLFDLKLAKEIRESDARVLSGQMIRHQMEIPSKAAVRLFDIIKVPVYSAEGHIIGLCGIARDITENKRLEDLAERAKRLEAAGRIAGQVAHDFNNLLGPLIAYPEFIAEELDETNPARPLLADIEKAAHQMAEINQQLLTLGRRGHYTMEPINLNNIIEQAVSQLHSDKRDINLDLKLQSGLPPIKGGGAQLLRGISNLLINALDAIGRNGSITVCSEAVVLTTPTGNLMEIPHGEFVRLSITDDGPGIEHSILNKIFEPFFTTKATDKKRGSGLGLSIVHAVIADHNGFIDVHDVEPHGTCFELYLPVMHGETETTDTPVSVAGGSESVLVIDDDAFQREVTENLLTRLGYQPTSVASGEEALELLDHDKPDLLILDMVMSPGIDGVETYRRAIRKHPDLKAIIVSGYAESQRMKSAEQLGLTRFVRKPLTLQSLNTAIRAELDTHSEQKS